MLISTHFFVLHKSQFVTMLVLDLSSVQHLKSRGTGQVVYQPND